MGWCVMEGDTASGARGLCLHCTG